MWMISQDTSAHLCSGLSRKVRPTLQWAEESLLFLLPVSISPF